MDDAISRKGTSAWLENMGYSYPAKVIMDEKRFPSVVPKKGRWKSVPLKRARICSCCGHDEPYKFADDDAQIYNFCPNCGAKMEVTT